MNILGRVSASAATLVVVALLLATTEPAMADASHPNALVPVYTYSVVDRSSVGNHVGTEIIGRCQSYGATCTIASGTTATVSIALSLGATRDGVAAGLGITGSSSVTVTVSCTSPVLSAGQTWYARPMGTYYTYKVKKTTTVGFSSSSQTSGWLNAFKPYASAISCSK